LPVRVVSRFGDISPAFADAYGASVDVALSFASRNAAARARSAAAHAERGRARVEPLPLEITAGRSLPPSRVSTAVNFAPKR
jgi:hypothetical protein